MPSPIAHSSLVMLARPLIPADARDHLPRGRRLALWGAIVFALCAPDVDFLLRLVWPTNELLSHGGLTHSLVAGVIFSPFFAVSCRWLINIDLARLAAIGCACYWIHVLMDVVTWGRGVMVLWPFSDERIAFAFPLFYGAQHSRPLAWKSHLITLANEGGFAAVVWIAARWLPRSGRRNNSKATEEASRQAPPGAEVNPP